MDSESITELAVVLDTVRTFPPEIHLRLTPTLEAQIRSILKAHRHEPHQQNVSTPQMVGRRLRIERALEDDTVRQLLLALMRHQTPVIDTDLLGAIDRLETRLG